MSNLFWDLYLLWSAAYKRRDLPSFDSLSESMLQLIADWDALLATNEAFLLGRWISSARSWATTEEEANLYEFNARNQLTLWGPKAVDTPQMYGYIIDYAAKNWAGLAAGFYLPRWKLFFEFSREALAKGVAFPQQKWIDLEMAFCENFDRDTNTTFPTAAIGNTEAESLRLQGIYGDLYESPHKYNIVPDTDVSAACNLNSAPAWTDNLAQLKYLCDSDTACIAFSSSGYFKWCADENESSLGITLYLKQ